MGLGSGQSPNFPLQLLQQVSATVDQRPGVLGLAGPSSGCYGSSYVKRRICHCGGVDAACGWQELMGPCPAKMLSDEHAGWRLPNTDGIGPQIVINWNSFS